MGAAATLALPHAFPGSAYAVRFAVAHGHGESHRKYYRSCQRAAKHDYRRYCVSCHGELGDGNGEKLFPGVDPKPRDFQLGVFKCRSTPTGTLPTDEDLFDTIARGLDRSNMPQWSTFTKQERADLVAWVKHFLTALDQRKAGNAYSDSARA